MIKRWRDARRKKAELAIATSHDVFAADAGADAGSAYVAGPDVDSDVDSDAAAGYAGSTAGADAGSHAGSSARSDGGSDATGEVRLRDVPLREVVELVRIDLPGEEMEPLLELGLLPGCRLCPVRRSPFGDPVLMVDGSLIALRREMAGCLCVRRGAQAN